MVRAILLVVLLNGAESFSQELRIEDFVTVLLPAPSAGQQPGASGSLWETVLTVRNDADEPVIFSRGEPICRMTCPTPHPQLPAKSTTVQQLGWIPDFPYVGALVYVERRFADQVTFSFRVRELSQNGSRPGTNIPVIREGELRTNKIQLLNVPSDLSNRINLRIFEIDRRRPDRDPRVILRVFHDEALLWMEERTLLLGPGASPFSDSPAEDVLFALDQRLPDEFCCGNLRIEIEPLDEGRYWAFAAVTHHVSQEVLLVTPE